MEKDFIIDKVSWHTEIKRNYELDIELLYDSFKNIIDYFQRNGLTKKIILTENEEVNEGTCIKSSDLNEEGIKLARRCYDKWTSRVVDKKISSTDYKMLDRELKKIREDNN